MSVIPIPVGSKNPGRDGWQDLRLTPEDIPRYWTNGQNIGLLTGEPSGWRVDVDLDASEAVKVAGRFLRPTLTAGRERRPHSHWWYVAPGVENGAWKDTDGKKLVEVRSTGQQTVVWPSTHPDGDKYVWHPEGGLEMAKIAADELTSRCRELATATLIARHLPPIRDDTTGEGGGRHDYALALAGFLLRAGRLNESLALKILRAGWDAKGWPSESPKKAPGTFKRWCRENDWVARAQAYDDFLELVRREAIEDYLREHGGELARRQQQVQEEVLAVKEKLLPKLREMAQWPLEHRVEEEDGKVVHIHPAKWDFNTLAKCISILDEKAQRIDFRHIDFDQLTDEQLDRIIAGEDPLQVLLDSVKTAQSSRG